ncbi:MAG: pteridine reductase [Moraxellaceae bacterium]|nr:MAG: pteridine reductase [Moraxellaceae bacterium]
MSHTNPATVLITGAAKRIGAEIAKHFHANQFNTIIHYHRSHQEAEALANEFNSTRSNSAAILQADLNDFQALSKLSDDAQRMFGRIDILINNASSFSPTPLGKTGERQWDNLFNSNAKAPFFLSQALLPELKKNSGCIINMVDIYAEKPLQNHTLYCMAKSALAMMTQSLAKELGPEIRVNGIAPGAILWPEGEIQENQKELLDKTCLKRLGQVEDIIRTIDFITHNKYLTGQIIKIDGGRSVNI